MDIQMKQMFLDHIVIIRKANFKVMDFKNEFLSILEYILIIRYA